MEIKAIDFVSFVRLKNGNYRTTHDDNHLENLFRLLRGLGYGYITENSYKVYFRKEKSVLYPVCYSDFHKAFYKAIKHSDTSGLPENVTLMAIYKHYRNVPLKHHPSFARYFEYALTEDELMNLSVRAKYDFEALSEAV